MSGQITSDQHRWRHRWLASILLTFGSLLIFSVPALAQWESIGNVQSVQRERNRITLNCRTAQVAVSVLSSGLIRVRMIQGTSFGPDESWAVVKTDWPPVSVEVEENKTLLRLTSPELILDINKSPCRFTFRDKSGQMINQDEPTKPAAWNGQEVRVWKVMPPDEYYYALGERAGPLEHKGRAYVNWNTDAYGYHTGTDPLYQSIPFLLALRNGKSYGIFFDNTYRSTFDLGNTVRDQYSFGAEAGELNYYFFYGPDPKNVIERFTELVGRMPLPPRWALGYQQCRWSYEPEQRVREIVTNFRRRRIPCDVIYLDIDYMDGFRSFTISQEKFPTFRQMLADFAEIGMKVVTIIDPGIKRDPGYWVYDDGVKGNHLVKMPDGSLYTGNVWPGECVFPDFTREATRTWWGGLYKELVEAGVKGFWNDMNEPASWTDTDRQVDKTMALTAIHDDRGHKTDHRKSHNVYGMLMAQSTFEGLRALRPQERPFVLTRASYAGGHRYAATWTGDNTSNWEHLSLWIPMILNIGLSGQPLVGPDIGGFVGSPTPELYTRFLQSGVLSPLCRTHSAKGTKDQEPWSYGPKYEAINRRYIEFRYQLLPYIYTAFEEAARTGLPVMRPLMLEYPEDRRTYLLDSQFLLGSDLLVAPVLMEGATSRNVYLPAGEWFNFWTGEKVTGPTEINVQAPLDVLPLFARGGAIIPLQQTLQYADEAITDPLTLEIFPTTDSSASLYEDDGLSYDYQQGQFARTQFRCRRSGQQIIFDVSARQGSYAVAPRSYMLKFNAVDRLPTQVQFGEKDVPHTNSLDRLRQSSEGWVYDRLKKTVWVKFPDKGRTKTVIVN